MIGSTDWIEPEDCHPGEVREHDGTETLPDVRQGSAQEVVDPVHVVVAPDRELHFRHGSLLLRRRRFDRRLQHRSGMTDVSRIEPIERCEPPATA